MKQNESGKLEIRDWRRIKITGRQNKTESSSDSKKVERKHTAEIADFYTPVTPLRVREGDEQVSYGGKLPVK